MYSERMADCRVYFESVKLKNRQEEEKKGLQSAMKINYDTNISHLSASYFERYFTSIRIQDGAPISRPLLSTAHLHLEYSADSIPHQSVRRQVISSEQNDSHLRTSAS